MRLTGHRLTRASEDRIKLLYAKCIVIPAELETKTPIRRNDGSSNDTCILTGYFFGRWSEEHVKIENTPDGPESNGWIIQELVIHGIAIE